jgi:dCTP deaminase
VQQPNVITLPADTTAAELDQIISTLQSQHYGLMPDRRIRQLAEEQQMLVPFLPRQYKHLVKDRDGRIYDFIYGPDNVPLPPDDTRQYLSFGAISYGLSSYGYDIRISDEFKIFTPSTGQMTVVDPKNLDPRAMVDHKGDVCIIPPNSFALARTLEWFNIPRNVLTICLGKSTYARIGVIVNVTPFEPEWQGQAVIEISNSTPLPCKIYANEGVAQVLFFEGPAPDISYADRQGKYQAQTGITLPRL